MTIRASDRAASERVLRDRAADDRDRADALGELGPEWNDFSLAPASDESPVTRRLHIGFAAPSRDHVDAFWQAGTDAGYRDDGAPGLRPEYSDDYYGAFLLDPDGNSAEAVHHGSLREGATVDHLWIRVADLEAATRFYEIVAPLRASTSGASAPDRTLFACFGGSFSIVSRARRPRTCTSRSPRPRTRSSTRFHRDATAAGYRDNGAPGERTIYHPGYYGAFVLDPDGNNIEVVNHNR